jgi:hypothetical protein
MSIDHMNDSRCSVSDPVVVSYQHERHPFFLLNLDEQVEYHGGIVGVQVARRFIGE